MEGEQPNNKPKGTEIDGIQLLLEWMEQQGKKETAQDFLQVTKYLEEMQTQLSVMTKELKEVKQQLSQFQQEQPRQQVAETIQEVSNLQNRITNISEKISIGKEQLKNTVAQAIATVKEKGKEEINQILQKGISKVKSIVENNREKLAITLDKYQKLARRIDAIREELKQVGTSIGNVGRLVTGKDAKEVSKEKQGIGMTRGINQLVKKHIVSLQQKLERTDKMLEKLDNISKDLGVSKEEKQEQRVSIQEKLSEKKEVIEQKKTIKKKEQIKENGLKGKGKQQEVCL